MARTAWLVRTGRADGGRRRRYQRWAGVLAAVVATGLPLLAATTAQASGGAGEFVSLTNSARSSHGLSRLAVSADLASVAQRQAQRMADKGELYHNPKLSSEVHNWQKIGENVGYGPDVASIHSAFMHSSGHRANILDKGFTQIGVGVVVRNGVVWVSEVFRQPAGAPAAAPHHPKPTPTPSPTPSPKHHASPASSPAKHVASTPHPSASASSHHASPTPTASTHSSAPTAKHSATPSHSSAVPTATAAAVPVVTSTSSPVPTLSVAPPPAGAAGPLERSTPADSSSGPSPWAALGTLGILAVLGLALSLRVRSPH